MLADFITEQIEMWNDCCWSDKECDTPYQQQVSEMDAATRKTQVTRMQQIFYEQAPYAVLYYAKVLIAYNTAKWDGRVPYSNANGLPIMAGDDIDTHVQLHLKAAITTTEAAEGREWLAPLPAFFTCASPARSRGENRPAAVRLVSRRYAASADNR